MVWSFFFHVTPPSHLKTDVSDGVLGPVILIELLRCRLRYIAVPVRRKAPIKDDFLKCLCRQVFVRAKDSGFLLSGNPK